MGFRITGTAMYFLHSPAIWQAHPELAAGALFAGGIAAGADVAPLVEHHCALARERLGRCGGEGGLPEVQAWRRAFARMGLKPTQYRCASESLLRRLRKEGGLPPIHPLVDLCNAHSVAAGIPVAAFDLARVAGGLEVRPAAGNERYEAFSGEVENPGKDEVIFADEAGDAHARRWTHRQSARSAIRPSTSSVLIVVEALHESAEADVRRLVQALARDLRSVWAIASSQQMLDAGSPRFDF